MQVFAIIIMNYSDHAFLGGILMISHLSAFQITKKSSSICCPGWNLRRLLPLPPPHPHFHFSSLRGLSETAVSSSELLHAVCSWRRDRGIVWPPSPPLLYERTCPSGIRDTAQSRGANGRDADWSSHILWLSFISDEAKMLSSIWMIPTSDSKCGSEGQVLFSSTFKPQ